MANSEIDKATREGKSVHTCKQERKQTLIGSRPANKSRRGRNYPCQSGKKGTQSPLFSLQSRCALRDC